MSEGKRSVWGWGYEARLPDASARAGLAQMASAMLGGAVLEPLEPPREQDLSLPAPRVEPPSRLREICSAEPADRARHCYGRAYPDLIRGLRGDFAVAPDYVAYPRDEAELCALLEACAAARIAAIPYGGGTSVVGGVEAAIGGAYRGAVSIDLGRLSRVLELDPVSRHARIQAGCKGPALEAQLAPHGFSLRHFPQSFEHSTLGGWIATRAGGHFATLYTHIDDLVASVRAITPAGGVVESLRLPASGAGPSPDRLLLGSEGALGVITEAWVRVLPRPTFRASATVAFSDWKPAVAATRAIAQAGLYPSNCRLLDAREARLHQVVQDGSHVLLLGFESADHPLAPWMERALAIAQGEGGTIAEGPAYREGEEGAREGAAGAWRKAFLDAPYLASALACAGLVVDTFETACTWDRFDALHEDVIRRVRAAMKSACGTGLISARFTHVYPDGPAPYYTFLAPARRGAEIEQWRAIKEAASEALVAHGATITHHHAVGRTHRPYYERQAPAPFLDALRAVKRTWDPQGVLNPGVLI
jgi:alkyldihydroxyacetonephosphate synthase